MLADRSIDRYNNSYSAYYQMIMLHFLDIDYNMLYLEGDVIMNEGWGLQELAKWKLKENGNLYVYAGNIQPENNWFMRKAIHFKTGHNICNVRVLLISCENYKQDGCLEKFKNCVAKIKKFECNADLFLWKQ